MGMNYVSSSVLGCWNEKMLAKKVCQGPYLKKKKKEKKAISRNQT